MWAVAEGWGDKGLVCKCNAMTFQSLEKKMNMFSLALSQKKLASFKSKQNNISTETAAIDMMMPTIHSGI